MEPHLVEPVCDWDEDAGPALEFLIRQVRETLPAGYCIHGEPFCLSCGIEWLVARSAAPWAPDGAEGAADEKTLSAVC
jgi:hypothetical protein